MKNLSFIALIVAIFLIVVIIVVSIIIFSVFKKRVETTKKKLPDLNTLGHKKDLTNMKETNKFDNSKQLSQAMSVTSDQKFNRADYITKDKKTTLEEDFGDTLDPAPKRTANKILAETKAVNLPTLDKV